VMMIYADCKQFLMPIQKCEIFSKIKEEADFNRRHT